MPHEVTCNPTDDTACDDELSNSFESNYCDSNHSSHFMCKQMNNHLNGYIHRDTGVNAVTSMKTVCPILPPFADNHDQNQHHQVNAPMAHCNHHLYHKPQHMNPQMHDSTNLSWKNVQTTQPITQPPQQSFVGKTTVEKAQGVISRLYKNSIATPNFSIFQNECATTENNKNAELHLNNNLQSQVQHYLHNFSIFSSNMIDVFIIFAMNDHRI